jgi:predicted dehydrogenase
MIMKPEFNRRKFVAASVVSSVATVVPRHVLGGGEFVAPSEKITLAHIGMGTQGFSELGGLLENPQLQIVAVCDPNRDSNNYVEWGKNSIRDRIRSYLGQPEWGADRNGCPGGRDVGRYVVDTYYGKRSEQSNFKACKAYADFRELLDSESDIDAVKVMTPDHLHATVSIAAMRLGKHVLVHKPLANRLYEGRKVVETARESKVATMLLAYGSGAPNGQIASILDQGVIGTVREIHNWTNRPVWPQYTEIPSDRPPVPEGFDWDLWLGPERDRPYHPHYTHTVFRGWYDFGGGSMADMGIYSLWPIFDQLKLGPAVAARAWATHTCTIDNNVSHRQQNDFAYPTACTLMFEFAEREGRPAPTLQWYDGGMKPALPSLLASRGIDLPAEGIFFVGDDGVIMAGFRGQQPKLFQKDSVRALWDVVEAPAAPSGSGGGRYAQWIHAIQQGGSCPGNFVQAAAITDTVNLGTIALRAGKRVEFDSSQMKITNVPAANRYLRRQYRSGWEL